MPKKGERQTAYCQQCAREAEWMFVHWVLQTFWLCLGCGTRSKKLARTPKA